ncbi:virulence factor TspB C-terminal domain-related protein [Methylobacillus methanolivorans]|uniref:Virulence factor TspB C-terminal domain-related protein n=1 Tax=Methylobacillus methanolivorans TaxID=1848927 RepID=A0ABW8GSK4_9PROT
MDTVQRLILVVLLLLLAPMVHADTVNANKTYATSSGSYSRDTPELSCAAAVGTSGWIYTGIQQTVFYPQRPVYNCLGTSNGFPGNYHSVSENYNCTGIGGTMAYKDGLSSPALFPMTCINVTPCPTGQVRQADGSCKTPTVCTPGCNGVCGTEQPLTARGTLSCFNGCYYSLGDAWGLVVSNDNNGKPVKTWWTDVEDNTGVPCDAPEDEQPDGAEDAPEKQDLPDPCPECDCAKKGMTWGSYTTNGTTTVMCLKPGTPGGKPVDIAPKPTVKTETPAPTPENPNPEPTTTITPSPVITITPGSGAGSQPTVTETTTNPDGSTTSTSEPQEAYCQKNPNAKVCKDADKEEGKGTWGGGCGSWECEGDAANCAMARKIHQDRCDDVEGMQQFENAATQGQRLLHGENDEDVTAYLNREGDGNRTVNVGSLVSDAGPYSFGASCISDVQFSIGGHSVSVPFSKICPYLEMIGYFLLAAAYLAALRIVGLI